MLYCHAEELDNNEHAEVNRVLEFMGIAPQAHAPKKVVTATVSLPSILYSGSSCTIIFGSKVHDCRPQESCWRLYAFSNKRAFSSTCDCMHDDLSLPQDLA